jgi:hypothetical protein
MNYIFQKKSKQLGSISLTNGTKIMEELTWKDARKYVQKVEPNLANVIDQFDPDSSYKLYLVRYPYGRMVFKKAILNLPNKDGELVALNHPTISSHIREQLSYRVIPMGLLLEKSLEMHAELDERVIPLMMISPGKLFGAWEILDPVNSYFVKLSWNISSGARTVFTLPKITDKTGYQRLAKEFDIKNIHIAKDLSDHWHLFRALAKSSHFPETWESKVLFFGKKWFEEIHKKNANLVLKNYLYETAWQQSSFWRFFVTLNLVWQQFSSLLKLSYIKCGSYPLETLKHIIMMGIGALPALTAYDPKEMTCPINALQKILIDFYEINYNPTIIIPSHVNYEEKGIYYYYSINAPTLIESVPKTREVSNVMQTTREIKKILECFQEETIKGNLYLENTPLYKMLNTIIFNFFHNGIDLQEELLPINRILIDKNLTRVPSGYMLREFCYKSKFLSGFIRMGIE